MNGCACVHRDARQCSLMRYGVDDGDEDDDLDDWDCECSCHDAEDYDDDPGEDVPR